MVRRAPRTARARRLGAELRRLREAAGVSPQDAADEIGKTPPTISNMELARHTVGKTELSALLDRYGASIEVKAMLEAWRREATQRGWWADSGLPDWAKPFLAFEEEADTERVFEPLLIPGLLQTEAYATVVHDAVRHRPVSVDIARRVAIRVQRQRRLVAEVPLELWVVIGEETLRRPVGGPLTMVEQFDRLLELGTLPNVKIQVLPTVHGVHGSMAGGFTVLSYHDELDPDVGYLEYPGGAHIVDDMDVVSQLAMLFDDLRDAALSTRDSAKMINNIKEEWSKAE